MKYSTSLNLGLILVFLVPFIILFIEPQYFPENLKIFNYLAVVWWILLNIFGYRVTSFFMAQRDLDTKYNPLHIIFCFLSFLPYFFLLLELNKRAEPIYEKYLNSAIAANDCQSLKRDKYSCMDNIVRINFYSGTFRVESNLGCVVIFSSDDLSRSFSQKMSLDQCTTGKFPIGKVFNVQALNSKNNIVYLDFTPK